MCMRFFHDDPRSKNLLSLLRGCPRAILGALPRTTLLLQRCRSLLFCSTTLRRACQDSTRYRRSAQLSFSRSQVHVCLHARPVPVFLECAWTLRFHRFFSSPPIRPFLLAFYRYSSPYTPLVAHAPHQLVTGSVFVSELNAPTSDSTHLSSQTATCAARQPAELLPACPLFSAANHSPQKISYLLSLFRYFSHFCTHALL